MSPVPLAAALLASITACGHVGGDGRKTTETRSVPGYTSIRLESSLDAEVKVGAPASVAVTIDSNLQPEIDVRVEGDTLVVGTRHAIFYRGVGKVQIGVPALSELVLAGSGHTTIDGSSGGDLRLALRGSGSLRWNGGTARTLRADLDGSGDVFLSGAAGELQATINGSGNVQAAGLGATSARVRVAGSGNAELQLRGGTLDAEVTGSGNIRWSGEAGVERSSVTGSGRIARR